MHHEGLVERIARQGFRDEALNVGGRFQILTSHDQIDESVMVIDNRRQVVSGEIVATPDNRIRKIVEVDSGSCSIRFEGDVAVATIIRA